MVNKAFYYGRVSARDQHEDRQIDAFKELGADDRDIITDKVSGRTLERPGYLALRNSILREGDTLIIKELDRLGRKKSEIKSELEYFKTRGVRVKIMDIPSTMEDFPEQQKWIQEMINTILIEVLSSLAEEEYHRSKRRQSEGIKSAHKRGVKFGRPKTEKPSNWDEVINEWKNKNITAVKAMELTGLTKSTFYNLVKRN